MKIVRLVALFLLALAAAPAMAASTLIPMPVSMIPHDGEFRIADSTIVEGKGKTAATAAFLARSLGLKSGARGSIRLKLVSKSALPNPEAYRLSVTTREIGIEASDARGLFYGVQTLRQLATKRTDGSYSVPAIEIINSTRSFSDVGSDPPTLNTCPLLMSVAPARRNASAASST